MRFVFGKGNHGWPIFIQDILLDFTSINIEPSLLNGRAIILIK